MAILISVIFVGLLLLGTPILFVFGLVPLFYVLITQNIHFFIMFPQRMFAGPNMFILLALPMFILAGKLMNSGGLSFRLISLAKSLIGHISGGLAQVNIVASMFFSGISGSALADSSAIGSVLIPAMIEEKYSPKFSAAITAISSTIGPIIPPSIAMIVYAAMANVSVAALFIGGVIPGLLLGFCLMIGTHVYTRINKIPKGDKFSLRNLIRNIVKALPALAFPFIILYGIFGGVFTPTEAAAVAVVYAIIIGIFVYRELTTNDLIKAIIETGILTGAILPIISTTYILSWVLGAQDVAFAVERFLSSVSQNKSIILLLINIILLIAGTILDPITAIILLCPIFLPIVTKLGVNLIHFGIIMVLNLVLGFCTPPHGSCLFICSSISKVSIIDITKSIFVFFLICLVVLLIVTFSPGLIMFLPNLFFE